MVKENTHASSAAFIRLLDNVAQPLTLLVLMILKTSIKIVRIDWTSTYRVLIDREFPAIPR